MLALVLLLVLLALVLVLELLPLALRLLHLELLALIVFGLAAVELLVLMLVPLLVLLKSDLTQLPWPWQLLLAALMQLLHTFHEPGHEEGLAGLCPKGSAEHLTDHLLMLLVGLQRSNHNLALLRAANGNSCAWHLLPQPKQEWAQANQSSQAFPACLFWKPLLLLLVLASCFAFLLLGLLVVLALVLILRLHMELPLFVVLL